MYWRSNLTLTHHRSGADTPGINKHKPLKTKAMKTKKGYNCNTWIKDKGKLKPIFWESKNLAIAYLKDTINSMEKGTVTKVECFFAEKSE